MSDVPSLAAFMRATDRLRRPLAVALAALAIAPGAALAQDDDPGDVTDGGPPQAYLPGQTPGSSGDSVDPTAPQDTGGPMPAQPQPAVPAPAPAPAPAAPAPAPAPPAAAPAPAPAPAAAPAPAPAPAAAPVAAPAPPPAPAPAPVPAAPPPPPVPAPPPAPAPQPAAAPAPPPQPTVVDATPQRQTGVPAAPGPAPHPVAPQPQPQPQPQQPAPQPPRDLAAVSESHATGTVLVRPGDSLWSIAQDRLGHDASPQQVLREVDRLWSLNDLADPDVILAGQHLRT